MSDIVKNRNLGIEVYRTLMMFGICMIHAVGIGGGKWSGWVSSALLSCVCGFVFISGYYGIRFKWIKLVKLYGLAFFAATITTALYRWHDPVGCGNVWAQFSFVFRDYWFLNAYAVLMLMAPLLNVVLEHSDRPDVRAALVLAIVCTIGWSFLAQLPYLRTYLPKSPGLHDYSGFMFMGIYIIAVLWRKYVEPRKVSVFVGGGGIIATYNDYLHPSALSRRIFIAIQHRCRGSCFYDVPSHVLSRMDGKVLRLSRAQLVFDLSVAHARLWLWHHSIFQGKALRAPRTVWLFVPNCWYFRFCCLLSRGYDSTNPCNLCAEFPFVASGKGE